MYQNSPGNGTLFVPKAGYDGKNDGKSFIRSNDGNRTCVLAWDPCDTGLSFDNGDAVFGACCSGLRVHGGWRLKLSMSGCATHWHYNVILSNKTYTAADGKVNTSFDYLEEAL